MATLINGNGNPAVYASQDADLIASICGDTTCISAVGSQFAATQEDANTIGLADGVIITKEGRRIQLDVGYTDLFTIPTGTAGTTSYYIIGYKLTTGSDSKQTCETFVQKMNSSSETITEDTFRGGASDVYVSVYRVVQDGLNIDSITGLLPTLSLGAQTSSSHSGSGSTVTTTLAANKTLDEVAQQMLDNDYALKSALTEIEIEGSITSLLYRQTTQQNVDFSGYKKVLFVIEFPNADYCTQCLDVSVINLAESFNGLSRIVLPFDNGNPSPYYGRASLNVYTDKVSIQSYDKGSGVGTPSYSVYGIK